MKGLLSLWGCELKYDNAKVCGDAKVSASLSVEMPFWLCYNRHDIGQSLWETVNWKEEYGMLVVAARKLTSILLEEDCEINHSHI